MGFRPDEAAKLNLEEVEKFFTSGLGAAETTRSKEKLRELVDELGPPVSSYPSWHPIVRNHESLNPQTKPNKLCGYDGLEHTRYFVHGFITCPYGSGQSVLDSVAKLGEGSGALISAERLDVKFYRDGTSSILVRCDWYRELPADETLPVSIALPLLLEQELKCWTSARYAETWEKMLDYFLGTPRDRCSSLFVNRETGLAMRKAWKTLIQTGMFGPVKT